MSAGQCRIQGFDPCSRKIPHAGQLSPHGTATEACVPRACAPQEKPVKWDAFAPQLESSPHSPQLEKSPCSNEDPAQSKINEWINKQTIKKKKSSLSLTPWGALEHKLSHRGGCPEKARGFSVAVTSQHLLGQKRAFRGARRCEPRAANTCSPGDGAPRTTALARCWGVGGKRVPALPAAGRAQALPVCTLLT